MKECVDETSDDQATCIGLDGGRGADGNSGGCFGLDDGANGFTVTVRETENLGPVKTQHGVPETLCSCHTGTVQGYTVEGHVPATDILRLLNERPKAKGLSVPGMPIGSPGMEQGNTKEPYQVILFGDDTTTVYAQH